MKVAIVLERIEPWRGGAETSINQYARALQVAGHDVHVITRSPQAQIDNLRIHVLDPYTALRQQRTLTFARHAADYTAKRNFDLVHAVTPCMTADIYQPRGGFVVESVNRNLALRQSPLGRSLKRLANNFNKKQQGMIRLEHRLMTRSQGPPHVAAVSEYVARQAKEHFNLPDPLARVVFNGVELDDTPADQRQKNAREIREQFKLSPDDLVGLFIAHNFKLKGLNSLIEAFEIVARRDIPLRLLVVGHDNAMRYRRLAAGRGLADRIRFVGATAQIRAFMHAADMLLHPTFYDPCSRVVLEAVSAGLPTLTTRFNGATQILTDDHTAQIIDDPADVSALADAIGRLADADHRNTIAKNALALRDQIDINTHARQMIQLYNDVYDHKKEKRAP